MPTVSVNLDLTQYVKVNSSFNPMVLQSLRDSVRITISTVKPSVGNTVFHMLEGKDPPLHFHSLDTNVWALAMTEESSLIVSETTPVIVSDFILEVRKGRVAGHELILIKGHNDILGATRLTISPGLSTTNINQTSLSTTPALVKIASTNAADSSAGTGLRTALLTGLDTNGDAQTETLTFNGTTEVTSANLYSAVFNVHGLTWGSGGANAGFIYCGDGVFTAGIPAVIYLSAEIGYNQTITAYSVVPKSKSLYLQSLTVTLGSANKDTKFFIETSSNGVNWVIEEVFELESGSSLVDASLKGVYRLDAGTHIRVEGMSSASSTSVSVEIEGVLVDDGF